MTEYKKYDTAARTNYFNVRLAKDAQVKEYSGDSFVSLTFVDSSRNDNDEEIWVDAAPMKSQTEICSFLEKGDVIALTGKLTMRRYGDDKSQVAHYLRYAEVFFTPDLIAILKERGFVPGAGPKAGEGSKPSGKGKAKGKPAPAAAAKKSPGRPKKVVPIEIDLDEDDADEDGEE